jgi:hypothetical protein
VNSPDPGENPELDLPERKPGILSDHSGDREAILVKANVLRWRGDLNRAIALYQRALAGGEEFDARSGLVYAFLSSGDIRRARAERSLLKVQYPYKD